MKKVVRVRLAAPAVVPPPAANQACRQFTHPHSHTPRYAHPHPHTNTTQCIHIAVKVIENKTEQVTPDITPGTSLRPP